MISKLRRIMSYIHNLQHPLTGSLKVPLVNVCGYFFFFLSAATEEADAVSVWSGSGSQFFSIIYQRLGGFCHFKVSRPSDPRLHCHSEQHPCEYLSLSFHALGNSLKLRLSLTVNLIILIL